LEEIRSLERNIASGNVEGALKSSENGEEDVYFNSK